MIESPPSPKNESSTPTESRPSTSANRSASCRSRSDRGARPAVARAPKSGAGSARRSSLPAGPSGSASSTITADGTMYDARNVPTKSVTSAGSSAAPGSGTTYPTSRLVGPDPSTVTTARATPGDRRSADSISPSSMRNPRIFTWKSVRPRYSSWPEPFQRTRSPVRYMRLPGSPNGLATNRSPVVPGRA